MSSEPASAAAIAGVVDRPRLYRLLESPLVRLCVVEGPSGCGKTTLLRSWALQQKQDKLVWVSLSGVVNDRKTFWQHVANSASRMGGLPPDTAIRVKEQLSLAADPVRLAAALLVPAGPVVLVVDAYEHLGELMPRIDDDLARLVAAVPELRVMITTRARTELADLDPPGGVVRVITLRELALTLEEVAALIAEQTGIVDERLARSVASATRGFALTVRAVVLTLAQLGRIPRVDSAEWNEVVAARLESLLPDAAAVQFVTDTSVPPYVDVGLGQLLSSNPHTAQLLDMLERNGFGRWIPYARHRPVFQYVETIRDTFRARAAADPERFRRSCVTTAAWLLENEETVDQALQFAIDGCDYALADRVFVSVVIGNPDSYISDRFLPTLSEVPEQVLEEYPMLAFGLGLALMANPMLRRSAPRIFRIAIDSPSEPSYIEPSIDTFSHVSMRAIARRLALDWQTSSDAALDALSLADAMDPGLLAQFGEHVGTILRQLSYSIWQGGRIEEALAVANRSVALCSRPAPRNYSMVYTAGISAFAGDTAGATAIMSAIDADAWPPEMHGTSMNGLGLLAEAYIRLDAHDFTGAEQVLHDTQSYMRTNEYWPFMTAASVLTKHGLGLAQAEAERVTRELTAADAPPGVGDNVATQALYAAVAGAWMAAGDHRTARRILEDRSSDSPFLAAARVTWLLGARHDKEALARAREQLELAGHTIRTRAETQTAAAAAALRCGQPELAWSWLSAAAVAWETTGPRVHVALLDPRDRRALWELAHERNSPGVQGYLDVQVSGARPLRLTATLTPREEVVLSALAEHEGIRAMAEALFVSPHTVKTQLQSIYRKLGVSSRQGALAVARESGLLDDPSRNDQS